MGVHDAINTANAETARAAGWPELTGQPKQIGWAITIRADKMREFGAALLAAPMRDEALFREALLRETQAARWIDARDSPWNAIVLLHLTEDERTALLTPGRNRQDPG
ncbi:hypothetical protein [Nocardia sp. alder85J]|uniref:hypothetical protein n=1 Tax=Nocardia sp. alder85J TaxID=2862949 RepID=UPI001CD56E68|nr:hypothetical protein [Nocardia sp. alder85J]MCX4099234.1 hypothetical protein [Nocardia sp. alder85J]